MTTLDAVIPNLKRKGRSREFCGPCPLCNAGEDRFIVSPDKDLWWCRVCNQSGDTIEYYRKVHGMTFSEAKQAARKVTIFAGEFTDRSIVPLDAPQAPLRDSKAQAYPYQQESWQNAVAGVLRRARPALDNSNGAYEWLANRGIDEATVQAYGLGHIPKRLTHEGVDFYKGLAIPHYDGERYTAVRIRMGPGRYRHVPGGTGTRMFGLDKVTEALPTIITESELDALVIKSLWPRWLNAVATGGTSCGRADTQRLLKLLGGDTRLLICAYDADENEAGDRAYADYWQPMGARRLRPVGGNDVCDMYAKHGREAVLDWVGEVL